MHMIMIDRLSRNTICADTCMKTTTGNVLVLEYPVVMGRYG